MQGSVVKYWPFFVDRVAPPSSSRFRGDLRRLHLGYLADPDAHGHRGRSGPPMRCRVLPCGTVQLVFIFYGLPAVASSSPRSPSSRFLAFAAGMLAMSLNSAAYVSEVVRAESRLWIKARPVARSIGGEYQSHAHRGAAQAIRNILPALGNEFHYHHQGNPPSFRLSASAT